MIDPEPLIVSGLDRLVPLPSGERADWQDVLGRAGETRRRRLRVPRPGTWSRLQIAIVLIVVGLLLAAAATATYPYFRGSGGPAFGIAHRLTPRQMVASDVNHTSYRDTRLWSATADRLSWEIERFGDLRGFSAALQEAIRASNALEPESHSNRCYRWIAFYREALSDLQTRFRALGPVTESSDLNEFAWKAKRANQNLRHAAGHVWGACVPDKDRP